MSLLVDLQIVPNRILKAVQERIKANRQRSSGRDTSKVKGATKPRAQRSRFAANSIEYRRPEPSAQRGGGTGGWIDVHQLIPDDAPRGVAGRGVDDYWTQISVGSGDGTKWATHEWPTESAVVIGGGIYSDGGINTIPGLRAGVTTSQFETLAPSDLPPNADIINRNPFEDNIFFNEINWNFYTPQRKGLQLYIRAQKSLENSEWISYLVYPVDDNNAVVTVRGNRMLKRTERTECSAVREPGIRFLADGPVFRIFPPEVSFSAGSSTWGVTFPQYWQIPSGGIEIPTSTGTAFLQGGGYLRLTWYYFVLSPTDTVIRNRALILSTYGLEEQPNQYQTDKQSLNIGFVVNQNRVKKIDLPSQLVALYNQRWPLYNWETISQVVGPTFDPYDVLPEYVWEETGSEMSIQNYLSSCMGISGNARVNLEYGQSGYGWVSNGRDTSYPATYLMGSPGIFDYYDSNFNDWAFSAVFSEPKIVESEYAPETGTPLFSPDHTVLNSGFKAILDSTPPFSSPREQIMIWLYLKPNQRAESASIFPEYLGFSTGLGGFDQTPYNWSSLQVPPHPEFHFSVLKQTPDGIINEYDRCFKYSWVSANPEDVESCFMKTTFEDPGKRWQKAPLTIKLSPARKFPPSLYQSKLGEEKHPYQSNPSFSHLSMIFWTAWGKNWRTKLIEIGFQPSDLSP